MTNINRLRLAWKALLELGPGPLTQYSLYQISLRSGILHRKTPGGRARSDQDYGPKPSRQPLIPLPDPDHLSQVLGHRAQGLLAEADEICEGRVRLFGGGPRPPTLTPEPPTNTSPPTIHRKTSSSSGSRGGSAGRSRWHELTIFPATPATRRPSGLIRKHSWTRIPPTWGPTGFPPRRSPCG